MDSLTVTGIDDGLRRRLADLAAKHGRSIEEEAKAILSAAVSADARPRVAEGSRESGATGHGLGTRIAARFAHCGLDAPIQELRGQPARPADFGE